MIEHEKLYKVKLAFDTLAKKYNSEISPFLYRLRLTALVNSLSNNSNLRFLELGSGTGLFFVTLLEKFKYGYGVDLSVDSLSIARERISNANLTNYLLIQGDYHYIPMRDASLDAIVMIESLQYAQDCETLFKEIYRVLKDGGKIIVIHWNGFFSFVMKLKRLCNICASDVKFVRYFIPFQLRTLLARYGFKTTAIRGIAFFPFEIYAFRNLQLMLNRNLTNTFLKYFSFTYYLEAIKNR